MKTILFLLVQFSFWSHTLAQTTISGRITDEAGRPLPLANIYLHGTYDGATADDEGTFEFTTSQTGVQELRVKFTGFQMLSRSVALTGLPQFIELQLKEQINALDAVTITAGSFTAGDELRRTLFRAVDIATTAGATADIAGALNTLPGTQKVGESGRLFVRGGDGDETRTFIDGLLVLDAYSPAAPNAPSRGRFLPFMFKGTSFSTGGYSAEYGQALSSALVLDSKDKAEITRTDIGLLSVGGDAGHTHVWDRGSLAGKMQYSNLKPYFQLINQKMDWVTPPVSVEGQAAYRQQSGKHGMLKAYANYNQSDFSLYNHPIAHEHQKELYDLTNGYRYLNTSYKNALNDRWAIRGGISYTHQRSNIKTAAEVLEQEKGMHGKAVVEGSLSERVEVKAGIETISRSYTLTRNSIPTHSFQETITSAFGEADVYASNRFISRGGLRVEYNPLNDHVAIDPRFSLAYKTGSTGQVSLAFGTFRQSPKNQWLRWNLNLAPEKAAHYILNYQRIDNNRTMRIEAYYKQYNNLVKFNNGNEREPVNSGYGFARGIEIFWRDRQSLKNVDYWIAYSFLNTKRNYLHFPVEATPSFASAHNLSVVYKQFIRQLKSQLGFTYAYASGRPYDNPDRGVFNEYKTPSYQDLSFNWSYLPAPSIIIYFSCTNLFGRDNIFGYEYGETVNQHGMYDSRTIRQPAKRFLFAGIFLTLSKEKSVNQLPNL